MMAMLTTLVLMVVGSPIHIDRMHLLTPTAVPCLQKRQQQVL